MGKDAPPACSHSIYLCILLIYTYGYNIYGMGEDGMERRKKKRHAALNPYLATRIKDICSTCSVYTMKEHATHIGVPMSIACPVLDVCMGVDMLMH